MVEKRENYNLENLVKELENCRAKEKEKKSQMVKDKSLPDIERIIASNNDLGIQLKAAIEESERARLESERSRLESERSRQESERVRQENATLIASVLNLTARRNFLLRRIILDNAREKLRSRYGNDWSLKQNEDSLAWINQITWGLLTQRNSIRTAGNAEAHEADVEDLAEAILEIPLGSIRDSMKELFKFLFEKYPEEL
jgi:hypothetical protein